MKIGWKALLVFLISVILGLLLGILGVALVIAGIYFIFEKRFQKPENRNVYKY